MNCPKCQAPNDADAVFCKACGANLETGAPAAGERQPLSENAGMRMLMPIGRSGFAIAAGYLGLAALFTGVAGPFAIVFAILGIRDVKRHERKHGMGRAIFGLVAGIIGTAWLLALIVAGALG